jgi:hypothetical protein
MAEDCDVRTNQILALVEQRSRCLRLANAINDEQAKVALAHLAEGYQAQIKELLSDTRRVDAERHQRSFLSHIEPPSPERGSSSGVKFKRFPPGGSREDSPQR